MDNSIQEKANAYDKNGYVKAEIEKAISSLKAFRAKVPFAENPQTINMLRPDDVFKVNSDEVGEFFRYLENNLKPLGHLTVYDSTVYNKIRLQLEDFKRLLYVVVDKKKSLAEKVDAPWGKIKGLGDDKQIAKKIIFCFNYESGNVLPIFSTSHLKYFANKLVDKPGGATKFYSLGEEYAQLTSELLKAKNNMAVTRPWEITFFVRFLYDSFPPPDIEQTSNESSEGKQHQVVVTKEQLELGEFMRLLGELQRKGKITGEQFRQNRELWLQQQPNDRDVLIWRLKQLLNTETKNSDTPRSQPFQKPRRM